MITTQDIAKLSKAFATKKELKNESKTLRNTININHSKVMATLGEIVGELQAIREEQTIGSYRQARHSDQLESHESRITKLESLAS